MSSSSLTLTALAGIPLVAPGDDLAALLIAALRRTAICPRTGIFWSSRKRSCRRRRAACRSWHRRAVAARRRPGARGRQGPAARRGHTFGISEVVAPRNGRPDRGASSRLRHGECRRRPVECRAARATSTCCCCRAIPTRRAAALEGEARRPNAASNSASSSTTVSAGLGATAWSASRSAPRACRRCSDMVGKPDLFGRKMRVTEVALADEIAAAASLLMGQAAEGHAGRACARPHLRCAGGARCDAAAAEGHGFVPMTTRHAATGRVVALCGGIGGAKLALGLDRVLDPGQLTVIVNTGDDFEHLGLHISPDLDTVLYTLGGIADPERGWGRADETWNFMDGARPVRRRDLVSARRPRSRHACFAHASGCARARNSANLRPTRPALGISAQVLPMSGRCRAHDRRND